VRALMAARAVHVTNVEALSPCVRRTFSRPSSPC
jgi:hypothetical protein